MLHLELCQVRASLRDVFENRGADRFVVHAVSLIEEPSDGNFGCFFVEIFEQLSEFCDREGVRSRVHVAPQALVGGHGRQSAAGSSQVVQV